MEKFIRKALFFVTKIGVNVTKNDIEQILNAKIQITSSLVFQTLYKTG